MTVGERLQQYRKNLGLSQEELGQRLLVSRQTISQWETDQTMPTLDNLMRLKEVLGVSVDALLSDENSSEQEKPKEIPLETYQFSFSEQELTHLYRNRLFTYLKRPILILFLVLCLGVYIVLQYSIVGIELCTFAVFFFIGCFIAFIIRFVRTAKTLKQSITGMSSRSYRYNLYQDGFSVHIYENEELSSFNEVPFSSLGLIENTDTFLLLTDQRFHITYSFRKADLNPQSILFLLSRKVPTAKSLDKPTGIWDIISDLSFILAILSLPLAILFTSSAPLYDEIKKIIWGTTWRAGIFLPVPIASIIIGCILKSKKLRYKKNIITGIIMTVVLVIIAYLAAVIMYFI